MRALLHLLPVLSLALACSGGSDDDDDDDDDGGDSSLVDATDGADGTDGVDGTDSADAGDGTDGTDGTTGSDGTDGTPPPDGDGDGVPDSEDCAPDDPSASRERAYLAFSLSDRATVAPSALLQFGDRDAFTLSWRAWYTDSSEATLVKGTNASSEYAVQGGSSSISLVRQAMGLVGQSSEPNRLEAWAHYTVVYDGGEASFYLDGVPTGSGANRTIGAGSSSVLTLGNHEDGTDPLNGRLADVVIWNEARTPEEVADFVSGAAAPADLGGLVGHWPMDEGSGSEARDASGHGHDATVEGADWAVDCL